MSMKLLTSKKYLLSLINAFRNFRFHYSIQESCNAALRLFLDPLIVQR